MKYISKYSNGKEVSAAQYITEMICENKARKDKKDLHYRFWTNKEWASFYRNQIATANKLVNQFTEQSIIRALKDKKAEKIFSLRAPHLIPIIEAHEAAIKTENKNLSVDLDRTEPKKFFSNNSNTKKSILTKLKEIE